MPPKIVPRIRVSESQRQVQNINLGLDNTLTLVFNYTFYDSDDGGLEHFYSFNI